MKTILYAEDDANDILLIRMALGGMPGIHVYFVRDGAEAINYLAGHGGFVNRSRYPRPALICLDIKMPRVTGLEVLAWLQEQPRYAGIPVVMMSSSGLDADVSMAYDLGARDYLVKSSHFDEWRSSLERMVRLYLEA